MSSQNDNTIKFPDSIEKRLESLINCYETDYNNDPELLGKFINLLDDGCEEASYYIGSIYEAGEEGITKDQDKAIFYFNRSIEKVGEVGSYLALARIYYYGIGVAPDYNKSYEFYSLVEKETSNPVADFMLGKFYLKGIIVKKDLLKAEELFKKAVDCGYVYGIRCMADLEKEKGNLIRSLFLKLISVVKAFRIALKNPNDLRLRAA